MNIKKLIDKITENWAAKVICLSLAIFIYIFHQIAMLDKKTMTVPLNVVTEGVMSPGNDIPQYVKVSVRSTNDNNAKIKADDISAYLYLTNYTEQGLYNIPISIKLSQDLLLMEPLEVSVKPDTLLVNLDKKVSRYVPVSPLTSGEVQYGYVLDKIEIVPSTVLITGPSKLVNAINSVYTTKVNIKGAATNFTSEVNLESPSPLVTLEKENSYKANVLVKTEIILQTYKDIPINVQNLKSDFVLKDELANVNFELEASRLAIEDLEKKGINVYLDLSTIQEEGIYEFPLRFAIPSNIKILNKSVDKISVEIIKNEQEVQNQNEQDGNQQNELLDEENIENESTQSQSNEEVENNLTEHNLLEENS